MTDCAVCRQPIKPDAQGRVRYEGTVWPGSDEWAWGPVPVHDACRTGVPVPDIGDPQWEWRVVVDD